jgi:hypothetical protein
MKTHSIILLAAVAFAAASPSAYAQTTVDLGSAAGFAVLGGSGITIAGAVSSTAITGDIGSFPTPAITGLANVVLNGTNHAGDAVTQAAKTALLAAYTDAAGRTPTTIYDPIHDLGGETLTPGVYNNPTSFGITGTLTLDAQGNSGAIWIFQAGSTLTTTALSTTSNSQVVLINGALAENVFWQVGSSVTLGGLSSFVGTVLASESITLVTGATVNGRLLALNGAVTLDTNGIFLPGAIPEPAGMALLIAAGLGLGVGVRKLRRSTSTRWLG